MLFPRSVFFALLVACPLVLAHPVMAKGKALIVFAAASTTNAITEIGVLYKQKGLGEITPSFASSSTLAKQIEQGAPADLFLSANTRWMQYLDDKNLVDATSRKDLLYNRIALVVPADSKTRNIDIQQGADLVSLLGADGKLAVGDPEHVPVGMYGKQALEKLGLWDSIKDRIAPTKDVRAGLALVERGEVPLGLVYSSDVAASDKVRIIGIFPADSHPEIVYPVAAIAGKNVDAAKAFIGFLSSPEAAAIFKKYGFEGR
ncbi:molybdate ABC transporter substrate-binding protein [Desulfovibrio sp. OttesenSCG-928-G15]|nr:molybdate ABC transporter substrate-binding protein [Desulfovibrio sp. OttesenSCG-928-G15]